MLKKETALNTLFSAASLIILLIISVNLLSIFGWLMKIPISKFHFPLACIISIISNYFIQKRYRKMLLKEYIISVFLVILCFCLSLFVANQFLDVSYDGAWYHSIAIIRMKEGWNPIYELINSGQFGDVYIDSYSNKSIWNFGACIYALFNNLNSIKIISSLMAFAVTFLGISIFGKCTTSKTQFLIVTIVSICIGFNPIYLQQMYTNYIDSTLGLYCIFYVMLFLSYYLKQTDFHDMSFSILIICCIALMTNTKLTGLYFAATFFAFYIIIQIIKDIKLKKFNMKWFKKMFITGFIGVVVALIIGINPFITNVVRGHNVFYPILGSEKIEVMGANIPESLRSKSNLEKIIIANFSETVNSTSYRATKLQNPLAFNDDGYQNLNQDTRVGAFGKLFSLSLYITIITLLIFSKKLLKKEENSDLKKAIFWTILFIMANAILFSESWWGRYYPIIYIIPLILAIYYFLEGNKKMKIVSLVITTLLLINNLKVANAIYDFQMVNSKSTTDFISEIEGKKVLFWCYDPDKKWDYSYQTYFKEHNINAISADSEIEEYDFKGYNIEIKILDDK